uniref:C-type lectin domain-containing protein n=1 Tax=Heterorhabditis bacteriophora TaxID=37862 RepID=A0A1I7X289_HETBA
MDSSFLPPVTCRNGEVGFVAQNVNRVKLLEIRYKRDRIRMEEAKRGTGELNLYDFTSNRKDLCSHLDLLYDTIQVQNTTKNVPLARTIRNLYNNFGFNSTSLVLFTATSNQSDVDNTAHELYGYINSSLANGFSIVVVNYGNCSFYSWPRNQTAVYAADRISYRRLSKEIDDSICVLFLNLYFRAISLAVNRFQSRYHRENTKQMIILVASTFNSGGWTDPTQIAEIFKEDGGVIATIAYDQIHGAVVPLLNTLATPFYNITNTDYSSEDLRFLLCEANCFCPKNYLPYNMDFWGAPQGGCYNPITIPAINYLAVRYCSKHDNSILSIVENENKNNWLKRVFPSRTKFWIGLKYINGQWVWPNGYRLNYANWGPGEPNLQNGDCVYMRQYSGFNFAWFTDDCTNDWNYVCQAKPCDSTNFCRDITRNQRQWLSFHGWLDECTHS